ncbi:MAG: serine hydrolase domain-containing protein [Chitinophagaceae bacterium]
MKLLCAFLLLSVTITKAQMADTIKGNVLKDRIVARFNEGRFKDIYGMADSGFRANVSEDAIMGLLNTAASLGKVMSTAFIRADSNAIAYRLFFAKKSLLLNLLPVSDTVYSVLGLSFYKLPADRSRKEFASDNPLRSGLDSAVQKAITVYMSNKNVAGLSVGVLDKGKFAIYNYGETKKGNGQLPTVNTLYEIGSVTKTFTGILLANAVVQGKLKLEDDIRKYLPGNYPNLQFNDQPVRIIHLSNHTSRLPSLVKLPGTNEDPFDPAVQFSDKMLDEILQQITIDTLPGTKRQYSNFGTALLGIILEKVYGMGYEQLLNTYILTPYGMKQTKIVLPKADQSRLAQGYDVEGKETKYWNNRLAAPAGGIRSTANDMLIYARKQMMTGDSAINLSHRLTFGTMKEGTGLNWGILTTKKGYLRWSHDGGTDGFTSLLLIYPEINAGIILLTNNGDHDDQSFYNIGIDIYNYLINPH